MKDNLENILKDKLDNFELPYDASAWAQMGAKLDAKASPTTSRWYWIGGVAVITILSSLLIMTWENNPSQHSQNSRTQDNISTPQVLKEVEKTTPPVEKRNQEQQNPEEDNTVVIEYAPEKEQLTPLSDKETNTKKIEATPVTPSVTQVLKETDNTNFIEKPSIDLTVTPVEKETIYTIGVISKTTLCYGGDLIIRNNQSDHKVRARVNGKTFELLHNDQAKISNITSTTQVEYLNAQNEVLGTEFINIHERPNIFFRTEANLYNESNGLPVIQVSNTNEVFDGQWYLDGEPVQLNENEEIYCYSKGNHLLSYEVTDLNGCTFTEQKSVEVDQDFNLMANNALNPESTIPENRTFLPQSLKRMNVPFTFRVIDPSNGGVIYETNDITQPWDGIDIRTGQLAKYNQTFIWQVSLEKTIENAPKTYRGDVILVQKK